MRWLIRLARTIVLVLIAFPALAVSPRVGWTKVSVRFLLAQPNASAPARLADLGVDDIESYPEYELGYARTDDIGSIRRAATKQSVLIDPHDEFDHLTIGTGTIDTRLVAASGGPGLTQADRAQDQYGLYLVQFHGPIRPEWLATIEQRGAVLERGVAWNGYLIGLRPNDSAGLKTLPYVAWLAPFHKEWKAFPARERLGEALIIEFAKIPGAATSIAQTRDALVTGTELVGYPTGGTTCVVGRFGPGVPDRLIADPAVVAIYPVPQVAPSDEAQAMSLTDHVTTINGNVVPTNPGEYKAWLIGSTRCTVCASLNSDGFKISIADMGLHNGTAPADLSGRVTFGPPFLPTPSTTIPPGSPCTPAAVTNPCEIDGVCSTCDGYFHGTMVADIAGGDGAVGTGKLDKSNFYLGTGVAPTAGLRITKIYNANGFFWEQRNIFHWARDATDNNIYVQNHSHNQLGAENLGAYTVESQQFDKVVRGVDANGSSGVPITLVVAGGNRDGNVTYLQGARPPATAKNVISVGGIESVRDDLEETTQGWGTKPLANTVNNTWINTGLGTNVTNGGQGWNTYIKPDLMAPATQVTASRTSYFDEMLRPSLIYRKLPDDPPDGDYIIGAGTSFAAPVVAGAALIASRVYAEAARGSGAPSPAAAHPALIRAMLITGTRTMRGGLNASTGAVGASWPPAAPETIGPAPNAVQGFGRVHLADIVSSTPQKQYVNREWLYDSGLRTFTRTYEVDDRSKPVKVTLAWSDVEKELAGSNSDQPIATLSNPVTSLLVNDLNLEVHVDSASGPCKSYYGNNLGVRTAFAEEQSVKYDCGTGNLDTKNTAEKVVFPPSSGDDDVTQFTVVVRASSITSNADPNYVPSSPCTTQCKRQDFSLYVYNAKVPITLAAPANFTAERSSTTSIGLSWQAVLGGVTYEIWRGSTATTQTRIDSTSATTYTDISANGTSVYVYSVRALDYGGTPGAFSTADLAQLTSYTWTDEPLVAQLTAVKAVHFSELRTAIDDLRAKVGLGGASWQGELSPGQTIRAAHIAELRTNLDEALAALQLPVGTYTNPLETIRTVHIQELRAKLK